MLKKAAAATVIAFSLSGCFTGQEMASIEQRPKAEVAFTHFTHVVPDSGQADVAASTDMSLAQMIADPRDLVTGKAGGAVDAELSTNVIQAVREERFSITVDETTTTGTSSD